MHMTNCNMLKQFNSTQTSFWTGFVHATKQAYLSISRLYTLHSGCVVQLWCNTPL